jgi:hypothetical protein
MAKKDNTVPSVISREALSNRLAAEASAANCETDLSVLGIVSGS